MTVLWRLEVPAAEKLVACYWYRRKAMGSRPTTLLIALAARAVAHVGPGLEDYAAAWEPRTTVPWRLEVSVAMKLVGCYSGAMGWCPTTLLIALAVCAAVHVAAPAGSASS